MMKKHSYLLFLLAILTLGTLAGCGNQKQSTTSGQQVLRLSTSSEVATLDNAKADEGTSLTQLYHTGEGLYRLGKDSKIENALATKTTVSNNGLTYTFKLRTNDKWNNGQPVTAHDFVYGWQRVANPKTASEYAYLFEGIKNFDAIQKGKLPATQLGVKAPDKHTLVVTLSKPVPYFKLLLAFPTFFPEQRSAIQKYGSQYGTTSAKTAYNGPFKPEGWTGSNDTWQLVKNNNYWDKKAVHLNKIKFQVVKTPSTGLALFQQGKLDATTLSGTQVQSYQNRKGFKKYVGGSTIYLEMNQRRNKALKNLKIRQALSQAIDKSQLAEKVLRDGSTTPKGFVSTNLFKNPKTGTDFATDAYVKNGVVYNLKAAKSLWKQGLKATGQSKVKLSLLTDDTDQSKQTAQFLQSELKKLPGLSISITSVPKKTRMTRSANGQFDLVISTWGADFADPINFLSLLTTGNSYNNGKWSNRTYDRDIKASQSQNANQPAKRYQDLVNAEKVLMKDQGVIPLYQPATAVLWKTNVHGFIWNPAGMSNGYKNIYLSK